MRAVVQRVLSASVAVNGEIISAIDKGILVLVGFNGEDNKTSFEYMSDKILNLRIFEDSQDKMNLSLLDMEGELLVVPNFTLYGDCRKGRRPSYSEAAKPESARTLFEDFVEILKEKYDKIGFGQFQADMKVSLINDGPITLMIDSQKNF